MAICYPITTCARQAVYVSETIGIGKKISSLVCTVSQPQTNSYCSFLHSGQFCQRYACGVTHGRLSSSSISSQDEGKCLLSAKARRNRIPLMIRSSIWTTGRQSACVGLISRGRNMSVKFSVPNHEKVSKISLSVKPVNWRQRSTSAGAFLGLCLCFANSEPVDAELAKRPRMTDDEDENDSSNARSSHGKKVYTDYSITGIPGDGRCLFRSVVHGACLRSGKPSPDESRQKELADELRTRVADEFVKRREETEWFIEGDFDTYVSRIRQPHVWGGEPELFMASHVLKMPITVYMRDEDSGGLIAIAEYGQEYGKEDPIRVLYHGYGHYDALQIPGMRSVKSRL